MNLPRAHDAMTDERRGDASAEPLTGRWTASRPLVASDLPFLHALVLDPAVGSTLRYQGATPSFDDFARRAWDGVLGQWIVTVASSGEPLGVVVVSSPDFRNGYAFLSVIARPSTVGSGVMMDGVASVLAHVFSCWPFRQLYFEAAEENFRQFSSGLGRFFVQEGCRRQQLFAGNRYQDVFLLTLTRTAWEAEGAPMWRRLCARPTSVA
jgi:RimJ/RimL family protein N-acetyltransferase